METNSAITVLEKMLKDGYTLQDLIEVLKECSTKITVTEFDEKETFKITLKVTEMLRELRIPTNVNGYSYLRYAIIECYKDRSLLKRVTRVLYPQIKEEFGSTIYAVDRAMLYAIRAGLEKCSENVLEKYFGKNAFDKSAKSMPNVQFISTLVEDLDFMKD